ncbi:transcriptional regulator [Yersinia pseudotuberculosis]|uniref:helix-turn-helix transcriptional regulator n=1 Tax=Yersinia TaxID=629 RepID=UPI0005E3448C|nr:MULTISPECIES: AlpA family phage regulatory protein [Yersinia]CNK54337.1 transcriptional regulator [Yersinia pseudotuberculosis]
MSNRILKKKEVLGRCGISAASLYRYISNGCFPSQRLLSPGGRAVGWLESDIENWVTSRQPVQGE